MICRYRLSTSPTPTSGSTGALGVIEISGDLAGTFARLSIKPVDPERVGLREWPGVDIVVVARTTPTSAIIFPHGGHVVLRRALGSLDRAGLIAHTDPAPMEHYPEANSLIEARMLVALQRAQSPLAIDLLLDQPRRWAAADRDASLILPGSSSAMLNRLIEPPTIVAVGAPNIGKSSVLNALAGRGVSIVADVPGTTRDHIGVALNLAGLVVRFIDTPGVGPLPTGANESQDALDAEAQTIALRVAASADLLLLCADATSRFVVPPVTHALSLRVGLRSDLGPSPEPCDVKVSVRAGLGLDLLAKAIRETLIPAEILADPRAWRFWQAPTADKQSV